MIKLERQNLPKPPELTNKDAEYRLAMGKVKKYLRLSSKERQRIRPPFDNKIVFRDSIIEELKRIQHEKCAYCETQLKGDLKQYISHYRPTSNAVSPDGGHENVESYIWFAYEWQNLLLICKDCQDYKLSFFPISGPLADESITWTAAHKRERPLLLNPYVDFPSNHLQFDADGLAYAKSKEGAATVEVINLNRTKLAMQRKGIFGIALHAFLRIRDEFEFKDLLSKMLSLDQPHSAALANCLGHVCRILTNSSRSVYFDPGDDIVLRIAAIQQQYSDEELSAAIEKCKSNNLAFIMEVTDIGVMFQKSQKYAYIEYIQISKFKNVENFSLVLRPFEHQSSRYATPCTMLLGENAVGKSSIIQAIALSLMTGENRRRLRLKAKNIVWNMQELNDDEQDFAAPSIKVSIGYSDGSISGIEWSPEVGRFVFHGKPKNVVLGYGARRYFTPGKFVGGDACPNKTLFHPSASLQDPAVWLISIDEQKFAAVARALRPLLSLGESDYISRNRQYVFVKSGNKITQLEYLSDGYKSIFVLAVDVMRSLLEHWDNLELAQGIVLIDEIENHLHPRWKMRVIKGLREAMPRVQFIASTHDPLCLRGMDNGEVKVLYRDSENRLNVVDDLPDISKLRVEQILTSDYFGLASTEDPFRQQAITELANYATIGDDRLTELQRHRRDFLLESYGSFSTLGDSTDRQIMSEALTRHIRDREILTPIKKREAREESITAILDVLERVMKS